MGDTVFHKILRREIPAEIIHEDEHCFAIRDIHPAAPVHQLIIPKKDIAGIQDATASDSALLGHLLTVANQLAKKEGLDAEGYRIVINSGENGGQTVFQLHVHLLGGRLMGWPPG